MLAAVLHRLRVVYERVHDTRFISHLDMTNTMNRALRRSEQPVAFTEGFSPRPRTAFGPPLPLFVEGEGELADFELLERVDPALVVEQMNGVLPFGIKILKAGYVSMKAPSITAAILRAFYRVEVKEGEWSVTPEKVADLLARTEFTITKDAKSGPAKNNRGGEPPKKVVDIRPAIVSLTVDGTVLRAEVEASPIRTLNVFDLMGALEPGFTAAGSARFRVVREGFVLQEAPEPAVAAS